MLVYNKYLKELGYKKSDFPFDKSEKDDKRYALNKSEGVIEPQTWNLDRTIILELYTYLRNFQEKYMEGGIPAPFCAQENGEEKWHSIVAEIIDGLKAYIEADEAFSAEFDTYEEYIKCREQYFDKFDKGWKLLGDNMTCFWW